MEITQQWDKSNYNIPILYQWTGLWGSTSLLMHYNSFNMSQAFTFPQN